jgi:hypothetical protein
VISSNAVEASNARRLGGLVDTPAFSLAGSHNEALTNAEFVDIAFPSLSVAGLRSGQFDQADFSLAGEGSIPLACQAIADPAFTMELTTHLETN